MIINRLLERLQGKDKHDGPERRKYARLVYPPNKRPRLRIRDHELEVIDISERGMKLLNYMQRDFGQTIYGTVEFSSGKSIGVAGRIVWKYKNEFGVLTAAIPHSIIIEEIQNLLKKKDRTYGF